MLSLAVDERGYPVPYFVAWVDGKPDHRIMDAQKLPAAVKRGLCWMCGQQVGKFKSFCIGPMCSITRTISEPPSHLECLRFAVRACPWMTRPHAKRRENGLPSEAVFEGHGIKRNPGAVCIWTTLHYKVFKSSGAGMLFELGNAEHTEWYANGKPATRAEVDTSITTGLPILFESAQREDEIKGNDLAMTELKRRIASEAAWLDRQVWPEEGAANEHTNA
jgi:hypothetical protein